MNKSDKKVGMLTWHFLDNYGSLYQSYALQKYIRDKGFTPEFINYRENARTGILADILRHAKYKILSNLEKRKSLFYNFRRKHFNESKMYFTNDELFKVKHKYSAVICGGDQIWSAMKFDKTYYLNFLPKEIKRYSYSPSSVHNTFTSEQKEIIKKELEKFRYISVRENYGKEILEKFVDKNIEVVLDPIFLLERNNWEELILEKEDLENSENSNYLLVSYIGNEDKYKEISLKYKELYSCDKIINVNVKDVHNFGEEILIDASPEKMLKLIRNAKMILTDSYHIALFSIIFNKDFRAVRRFEDDKIDNQNERIKDILRKLELENFLIGYNDNAFIQEIDYEKISNKLNILKKESIKYLDKILGDISDNN